MTCAAVIGGHRSASGAVAGAAAFGALHRYQGWVGVVATILVGLFLSGLHLASGAVWLAMALWPGVEVTVRHPLAAFWFALMGALLLSLNWRRGAGGVPGATAA